MMMLQETQQKINELLKEAEKNELLKEADKKQSSSDKQTELPDSQQGKSKMLEADYRQQLA